MGDFETPSVRSAAGEEPAKRPTQGASTLRGALIVADRADRQARLRALIGRVCPQTVVHVAQTLDEAVRMLSSTLIDLALVDICLPASSGIEVVHQIMRHDPLAVSVVVTDDDAHVMAALAAGAQGYLLHNQPDEALDSQLDLTLRGVPPLVPAVARRLLRHFEDMIATFESPALDAQLDESRSMRLSSRERAVLSLIAKGLQITQVADALHISAHTVGSHLKIIYRKRKLSSRAEAALEARKLGLV
jgi:DNA-binding NarL/FixJ family response regulator